MNLSPPLALEKGDKGQISINATNVADDDIEIMNLGPVEIPDDEKDKSSGWEILLGGVILVFAIVVVVILFLFTKPKQEPGDDASIEGIGGRRKYEYRTREEPLRRGHIPEREVPRRRAEPRGPPRRLGGPRS